jgi:dTDP-4-dehydrorhamnose reductase
MTNDRSRPESPDNPLRVLVLGAGGMLGHVLLKALAGDSAVQASGTLRAARPGFHAFDVDGGPDDLARLLRDTRPDCVICAIGVLDPMIDPGDSASILRALTVNAEFPHRLARAAAAHQARVLHVSTDAVFAAASDASDEDAVPAPEGVYAQSKLLGESPAGNVLNLRCSIVGPDPAHRRGLWEWLVNQPRNAEVTGFTDQQWNGVTTLQLARLCARLARRDPFDRLRGEGRAAHVHSVPPLSKYELLLRMAERLRPDVRVEGAPSGRPVTRTLTSVRTSVSTCFAAGDAWAAAIDESRAFG